MMHTSELHPCVGFEAKVHRYPQSNMRIPVGCVIIFTDQSSFQCC